MYRLGGTSTKYRAVFLNEGGKAERTGPNLIHDLYTYHVQVVLFVCLFVCFQRLSKKTSYDAVIVLAVLTLDLLS